jgi:prophage regulatory protein
MHAKLIRFPVVQDRTGWSRTTIWRAERAGRFPKRRQVGTNTIAWLESEIDEWICSRQTADGQIVTQNHYSQKEVDDES